MSQKLATVAITATDIATSGAPVEVARWTNATAGMRAVQTNFAGLTATAANITLQLAIEDDQGAEVFRVGYPSAVAKLADADTTFGDMFFALWVEAGFDLVVYALSSNAGDTAVTGQALFVDPQRVADLSGAALATAAQLPAALVGGRIDASVGAMAADVITAAAHDKSTAFPLKYADAGATQVARTGADADTLETLSDQIDVVSAKTALITSTNITVRIVSPVAPDGETLDLVKGDDYTADLVDRPIAIDVPAVDVEWSAADVASVALALRDAQSGAALFAADGAAADTTDGDGDSVVRFTAPITAAQSALLAVGRNSAKFNLVATLTDGTRHTVVADGIVNVSGA